MKELVENMNSKVYKRDTLFKIYRWADYICKVDFEDPVYQDSCQRSALYTECVKDRPQYE